MQYSVVGLPHYTIWHLYEPSLDDIRHMEEMENERKAREEEEKKKQDRLDKIQSQFDDTASQWEKDKSDILDMSTKDTEDKKESVKAAEDSGSSKGEGTGSTKDADNGEKVDGAVGKKQAVDAKDSHEV